MSEQINIRLSERALEIVNEVMKRDTRQLTDLIRVALLEYVEEHHPDLSDGLRSEFLRLR